MKPDDRLSFAGARLTGVYLQAKKLGLSRCWRRKNFQTHRWSVFAPIFPCKMVLKLRLWTGLIFSRNSVCGHTLTWM